MSRYRMYQVAELTGVAPATLRAWENRYGVVATARTRQNHRLYSEADVATLTRMAELVGQGMSASRAAKQVSLPAASAAIAEPSSPPTSFDLVWAAQTFDPVFLDRVLDGAFAAGELEDVLDGWLMPALADLGKAWGEGRVDVAGEHFVSGAVNRRLSGYFEAARPKGGGPVVVVGLPPRAYHQLAVLAFAVCLRRCGVDVRYLGADVPVEGWVRTVEVLSPAAAVVAVPTAMDVKPAGEVVRELEPMVRVIVGGGAAAAVAERHPVTQLPMSLAGAARDLATQLTAAALVAP
ncbi:MerR family transcriptional regulator [Ornithinimicrobium sp. Y1694]|uniref:MerR family transcriptional regulator n=1 Tax=Ornithinimicrobium sp. Y1694 TaxID=3418590 RepID=UPI003CFB7504